MLISHSFFVHAAWDDFLEIFKETTSDVIGNKELTDKLSNDEIVSGLKEALAPKPQNPT